MHEIRELTAALEAGAGLVDLTHPIDPTTPVPFGYPPVWFAIYPGALPDGAGTSELVLTGLHVGTHVDAPSHFVAGARTVDELDPLAVSGPCVVLDFPHEGGWQEITRAGLEEWERIHDEAIRAGDVVLIRTGHGRKWAPLAEAEAYLRGPWPFLGSSALDLLIERDVKAVGVETPDPDRRDPATNESHYRLLPAGVLIIENLANLEAIPSARCIFLAVPLPFRGASGSPVRALALV